MPDVDAVAIKKRSKYLTLWIALAYCACAYFMVVFLLTSVDLYRILKSSNETDNFLSILLPAIFVYLGIIAVFLVSVFRIQRWKRGGIYGVMGMGVSIFLFALLLYPPHRFQVAILLFFTTAALYIGVRKQWANFE